MERFLHIVLIYKAGEKILPVASCKNLWKPIQYLDKNIKKELKLP